MKVTPLAATLAAAFVLAVFPGFAQDTEETVVQEVEVTEEEVMAVEAPEDAPQTYDVWWGNRSISYGNYLKFDRITIDAMGPAAAPLGPMVFDTVHFDKDKAAVIGPGARAILDDAVRLLRANPDMSVQIEVQSTGGTMSAAQLGNVQRRAEAVRMYLVENGIASERISTATAGEARVTGANTAVIPVSAS